MAKFNGYIGFVDGTTETAPGVRVNNMTERRYMGDVIRETKQWKDTEQLNPNLTINNRISIVADDFAASNFSAMKYVIWNEVYWNISSVEIQRPRLVLSIGGVYNGPKASSPD